MRNFLSHATKYADLGCDTWKAGTRHRAAARTDMMRDAKGMVVADLHEQSPFQKSMQSLQSQQQLVQSQPLVHSQTPGFARHVPFSQPPRYQEFRRQIAGPDIVRQFGRTLCLNTTYCRSSDATDRVRAATDSLHSELYPAS